MFFPELSTLEYILVDVGLLLLFVVQHSAMASKTLKKKLWPMCKPVYRCLYTIVTSVALQVEFNTKFRNCLQKLWTYKDCKNEISHFEIH